MTKCEYDVSYVKSRTMCAIVAKVVEFGRNFELLKNVLVLSSFKSCRIHVRMKTCNSEFGTNEQHFFDRGHVS